MTTPEIQISTSPRLQDQLLATKFFLPIALHPLISRPHLAALLDESLKHPLTLISAPAGFGKTTLLSSWARSLPINSPSVAWVSLDEGDNEPLIFWINIITALGKQRAECFLPLLTYLQSLQTPSLKHVLTTFINLLTESAECFVLILDDYHVITRPQVHTTISYVIDRIPSQLRIILSTRVDPDLPLPLLRARGMMREIRTPQLRCTAEETKIFFQKVAGLQLPEETIQQVTTRTEGWLAGLQLLTLCLPEDANPAMLLHEARGGQRYISDYLTEQVLRQQPQDVQMFLLSTCILEKLNASLCDAVLEQDGSQQMLAQLERANLFLESLDSKREWYRYHAFFAQTLHTQLEQSHPELIPLLHHRASLWYARQSQTTTILPCQCQTLSCKGIWYAQHDRSITAILHALKAHQWQWAADLIEKLPLTALACPLGEETQASLREWLEQLPADIVHSRPRLCLACVRLFLEVVPHTQVHSWLNAAETTLVASLMRHPSANTASSTPPPHMQLEQENLLGEVFALRALLKSYEEDGPATHTFCQQALSLLSTQNYIGHAQVTFAQLVNSYTYSANDMKNAIESALHASKLAQTGGNIALAIGVMSTTALYMIGAGQLRKAYRLTKQALQLGVLPGMLVQPEVGWPALLQAEILREWNQLDKARSLIEEALSVCQQAESLLSQRYFLLGQAVLLRVALSQGELDTAYSALQEFERIGRQTNYQIYLHERSLFTAIDQVKLWIACGEREQAIRWTKEWNEEAQHETAFPFTHEREMVASVRLLLAKAQSALALEQLSPLLRNVTTGHRWGHVIEILLLQALAYQMNHEEPRALSALLEAIRLAEPEGYIRSFVDEGAPMHALLSKLREQQCQAGLTSYLDMVLAAFPQQMQMQESYLKQKEEHTKGQPLLDPLSKRELEVLNTIACGASNNQIAQELMITVDTVKRHISHIFSKLGVQNRVQAIKQARLLGLLDNEL